jgi:hypothetical protein
VMKRTGFYPCPSIDATGSVVVSHAGGMALVDKVRATGLDRALRTTLAGWRKPLAVHDPAKVILHLALTLALGGDCLADIATVRASPQVYGRVASDATVSRDQRTSDGPGPGPGRDQRGPGGSAYARLETNWAARPEHEDHRKNALGDRYRRDAGHRALGERTRRADIQTGLRVPSVVGVRRSTPGRDR